MTEGTDSRALSSPATIRARQNGELASKETRAIIKRSVRKVHTNAFDSLEHERDFLRGRQFLFAATAPRAAPPRRDDGSEEPTKVIICSSSSHASNAGLMAEIRLQNDRLVATVFLEGDSQRIEEEGGQEAMSQLTKDEFDRAVRMSVAFLRANSA